MTEKMDENYMRKRYSLLFETKKLSDCSFLIENEEIFTHKIILASCSPVFEAMFYGPLASTSSFNIIVVDPNMSALEFKQMLLFIYTDSVQISSIINAWVLVYIAKKYLIHDLSEYCLDYIRNHIEMPNLLLNYEYADLFNVKSVYIFCENNIQMFAKFVFKFDYHMKSTTLCNLLEQRDFNANEIDLIDLVVKWANTECLRQNLIATKDNIRSVLLKAGVLSRIRFLSITLNALNNNNEMFKKILQDDEIELLRMYQTGEKQTAELKLKKYKFCLIKIPRNHIELVQKMIFRRIYKTASLFYANYRSHSTTKLIVNKYILVNGICISKHNKQAGKIKNFEDVIIHVKITNTVKNEIVCDFYTNNILLSYGGIHIISISEPIFFEAGTTYIIDFNWKEEYSPCHLEYPLYIMSQTCEHSDINFQFSDTFDCSFVHGVCYHSIHNNS